MAQIEFFLLKMYGCLKFSSIDAVRLEIFCKEISTEKKGTSSFANNLLSNIFPFNQRILQEKINRTNFAGVKGRSSTKSSMLPFNPVNCGCAVEGGEYRID